MTPGRGLVGRWHREHPGQDIPEKSFRMSKSDLQAQPACHRKRDSIEAHLTIVFAGLAVSRWIDARTGWSIRKFIKSARR
jgi:transposase